MVTVKVKRNVGLQVRKPELANAARLALEYTQAPENSALTVVVGDDDLLRQLNLEYRQVDATTDVLAFPSGEVDPETHDIYLGDVVISLPRAQQQASADGHALSDELQLLVVHGTLHLLGHDHMDGEDRKKMQVVQEEILSQLGVHLTGTL